MAKIPSRLEYTHVVQSGVKCGPQHVSGIDILTSYVGIPVIQVYKQGLDPAALERSLQATLAHYPLLCGRLEKDGQGLAFVDGNDAGVRFSVHRCKGALPDYGPQHHMGDHLGSFYTPIQPWQVFKPGTYLFNVDVYMFDDGGTVLGLCIAHALIDGSAFWQFMKDWADNAQGKPTPDRPMDRSQTITLGQAHIDSHSTHTQPYAFLPSWREWLGVAVKLAWFHLFRFDKAVFRIPATTVQRWQAEAQAEGRTTGNGAEGITASELVTAHCLKVMSPLWKPQVDRYLGMVIDLRYKRSLRIPRYFLGNALGHRDVPYSPQELANDSLAQIALKSRTSPDGLTTEDLHAYLGLMERARQQKSAWRVMMRSIVKSLDGGFVLNNCSHFPIYDIDFGTGKPSWHDAIRVVYRMVMVIETPEGDGGFDIHLTATRQEIAAFERLYGAAAAPSTAQVQRLRTTTLPTE